MPSLLLLVGIARERKYLMEVVLQPLTLTMAQAFNSHAFQEDPSILTMAYARAAIIPNTQVRAIVDHKTGNLVGLLVSGCSIDDGRWWLYDLVIDDRYIRRGYGRAAIAALVAELELYPSVDYLYVTSRSNLVAQAFFVALGWSPIPTDTVEELTFRLSIPSRLYPDSLIRLQPITLANARACLALTVAPHQTRFVASTATSLVQAKFEPHWITQGIYADDMLVGFVMYGYDPDYGWGILRLLVDMRFQGRGYGRQAIELVIQAIRAAGGKSVGVSYEAENEVARRLYQACGFVETTEQPFGEPFAVLTFQD
ncbi:MAG TPA: hypothetical protein DEF47_18620 [Herpetosiphon sp.]|nr:hypothetical protein [Herpetosiphon sp.]